MTKISDLARFLALPVRTAGDGEIIGITCKSSECKRGVVFAALRGENSDGHDYVRDAYENGSRVFIVEHGVSLPEDATVFAVENSRKALATASLFICGDPQKKLTLIGVTGTKGKSTVTMMIHKILAFSGFKTVSSSTLGLNDGSGVVKSDNSTPESYILADFLARAVKEGATHAVIEVSSQGMKQHRVDGLEFDVGVMTNLSRDHIGKGEHRTFDEYKECKKRFFEKCAFGVFNADDGYYDEFSSIVKGTSYGFSSGAELRASNHKNVRTSDGFGASFSVSANGGVNKIYVSIPGKFAAYDALAAIAACTRLGVPIEKCAEALRDVKVSGRFEKVKTERDIDVVIDYAHNRASMKSALLTARELARGKVICVFGAVGGRTKMRRAALGKTAGRYADLCVITADDPNFEDPKSIAEEIAKSVSPAPYVIIPDREEAIKYACDTASDGDFILVAGKGHETYQLIRGRKIPFDERGIVAAASKIKANI
ncbi:MAG: UDP-N-acetylmuramoyl-L-alanyl-D-glutamate--2,6-diaminopimelate ligase [Clostridia bacterium]|nr:UDP-N-acetylmuramoyl-L-alanyl-D-glutamate--2,6-diaminopimelate ligase [Clostridia bacterium]